jgi:hypothetical protein
MHSWRECKRQFHWSRGKHGPQAAPIKPSQVVGNLVHAKSATTPEQRHIQLTVTLATMPDADRQKLIKEIKKSDTTPTVAPPQVEEPKAASDDTSPTINTHAEPTEQPGLKEELQALPELIRGEVIAQVNQVVALPREIRPEVLAQVEELTAASDEADEITDGSTSMGKEVKIKWVDPMTGWTLCAKMDKMGMVEVEYPPHSGQFKTVLQISDKKTGRFAKPKYLEQLKFFAAVAFMSMKETYDGPIRLIIELLGAPPNKQPPEFWFKRAMVGAELYAIREAIKQMEASRQTNNYPARGGEHCNGCSFRKDCDMFQTWAHLHPHQVSEQNRKLVLPVLPHH